VAGGLGDRVPQGFIFKKGGYKLKITKRNREDGRYYLDVEGRIDANSSSVLEDMLGNALKSGAAFIILNMNKVEYMSSMGIRVLLATYKKSLKADIKFRVAAPSDCVRNVLGTVALDDLLLK